MEIILLILLYVLSQNPDFEQSVKPLMSQLKNSEQTLKFLKDLAKFSETFQVFNQTKACNHETHEKGKPNEHCEQEKDETIKEKTPTSPTFGIADDFIENILESYFKKK